MIKRMRQLYLILNVILGMIVLWTYTVYLPYIPIDNLWVGMSEVTQWIFWISIMIAVVCYLVGFCRLYFGRELKLSIMIWLGTVLFYVGASLWGPMLMREKELGVMIALMMTSFGAFLLTIGSMTDQVTMYFFMIVLLHVLIMDNVIWYSKYSDYMKRISDK